MFELTDEKLWISREIANAVEPKIVLSRGSESLEAVASLRELDSMEFSAAFIALDAVF
jgi:hypothetical protein